MIDLLAFTAGGTTQIVSGAQIAHIERGVMVAKIGGLNTCKPAVPQIILICFVKWCCVAA